MKQTVTLKEITSLNTVGNICDNPNAAKCVTTVQYYRKCNGKVWINISDVTLLNVTIQFVYFKTKRRHYTSDCGYFCPYGISLILLTNI